MVACDQKDKEAPSWELSTEVVQRGPVQASLHLGLEEMSILDTQTLKIEVQAPQNSTVAFPNLEERFEDYRLVPWEPTLRRVSGNTLFLTRHLALEAEESGSQRTAPVEVVVVPLGGDEIRLRLASLSFDILPLDDLALLTQALEGNLGVQRPHPYPWLSPLLWSLLGLALVGGAGVYLISKRQRPTPPPPPPEPAHHWAYRHLEQLVQQQQGGQLSSEAFVDGLSNVLRGYIERRFHLPALEQTSEEFLRSLSGGGHGLEEHRPVLSRFLEYGDLVKFAAQNASEEEVQKGFDFLKGFIEQTRRGES